MTIQKKERFDRIGYGQHLQEQHRKQKLLKKSQFSSVSSAELKSIQSVQCRSVEFIQLSSAQSVRT